MFLPSNITLKFGDSGDFVSELQRRLAMVKCFPENAVNGFFDGTTANAVTSFQSREGLHADGVAGPETLRRLNGVVSGDTSSSSSNNNQEEEAKLAPTVRQEEFMQQQPVEAAFNPVAFHTGPAAHTPYGEEAYRQPVQQAVEMAPPPHQPEPPRHEPPVQHHQPAMAPVAHAGHFAEQPHHPQQQAHPQPVQHHIPAPAHEPTQQPHSQMHAQVQPPQHQHHQPQPEQAAAQQPQGMMGRVRQFANAMIQKLNDYFEAKLPPSVMAEVQSIGIAMARSGMKEAPIPTGPELAGRSQELPARGPEQGQHRG